MIDLSGQRYGRLTVFTRVGTRSRSPLWLCGCDCGRETQATTQGLRSGGVSSCGCGKRGGREGTRLCGHIAYVDDCAKCRAARAARDSYRSRREGVDARSRVAARAQQNWQSLVDAWRATGYEWLPLSCGHSTPVYGCACCWNRVYFRRRPQQHPARRNNV